MQNIKEVLEKEGWELISPPETSSCTKHYSFKKVVDGVRVHFGAWLVDGEWLFDMTVNHILPDGSAIRLCHDFLPTDIAEAVKVAAPMIQKFVELVNKVSAERKDQ